MKAVEIIVWSELLCAEVRLLCAVNPKCELKYVKTEKNCSFRELNIVG